MEIAVFYFFQRNGGNRVKLDEISPLNDIEKLILLRKQLHMSQFQFANEIGISTSLLSQIERGVLKLNKKVLKKIKVHVSVDLENVIPMNNVERLFILRTRLHMSQEQFAKKLGISTSYFKQIERGKCYMTTSFLKKLEDFLQKETNNG